VLDVIDVIGMLDVLDVLPAIGMLDVLDVLEFSRLFWDHFLHY